MNSSPPPTKPELAPVAAVAAQPTALGPRLKSFAIAAAILCILFGKPLFDLFAYSFRTDLHSHLVLIPLVSAYLVWLQRKDPLPAASSSPALALIPLAFGLVALNGWLFQGWNAASLKPNDYLALTSFALVCLLWALALFCLGGKLLRALAFPVGFLIFIVPMPTAVEHAVEVFFQYTSAEAAALLFNVTGSTVFRDGLLFHLPGISIRVAEECSGIRSSFVLFITSLVAGHMFLRSPWRRAALTLFVIPLAILRNGFRVFTIAMLCVHVNPDMIDSPIHHRGGPIFFALSLVPFFALLLWLRRRDQRKSPAPLR